MALESRFSTDLLPVEQRFESWRESIGVLYDVKQNSNSPKDSFNANIHGYLLDNLMIARCRTSAQEFRRTPFHVARDGVDHFMIQLFLTGSQHIRRGRKEVESSPGDLMVHDLSEEHVADSSDFDNLSIILPRHLLAPLLQRPDSQHGRILKSHEPLSQILSRYMRDLYELSGSMNDEQRSSLDDVTASLIAATLNGLGEGVDENSSAVASSVLLHAKQVIDNNIQNSDLDAAGVAKASGVSRAALYRLFEPYDGVMNYIRRRRLYGSLRNLIDPMQQNRTIAEIAFDWGFTNEAHFSRAFRKQFKMSPSEARQQEQGIPSVSLNPMDDERIGDRNYETWIAETLFY